jgi:hypothetical protein
VVTHWAGRAMIKAMSLPLLTMQRIWTAYRLQPHRIRTFKRSTDPDFAANLDDVVGPYMNPPPASDREFLLQTQGIQAHRYSPR